MAKRKSTTAAATTAPATTEELEQQVAAADAKAVKEVQGETPVLDQALDQGYLGTVPEAGIQAAEYADLSNDAGYMGGPPKGEVVVE